MVLIQEERKLKFKLEDMSEYNIIKNNLIEDGWQIIIDTIAENSQCEYNYIIQVKRTYENR